MRITSKIVTLILLIVFFVGFCVLLYPAVSQYWNSRVQSKAVASYEQLLDSIDRDATDSIFEKAYAYNKALSELSFPLTQYSKLTDYDAALNMNENGMMGYISIDKIQVELPIYHHINSQILNVACGHMEGTSFPVGGEGTHCVLSAHRGLPTAKLFTDLDKLEIGDTFRITILDKVLTYEVDQIKIVLPDNLNDIQIEDGMDYVTLLTCTPYGINTHRLLVRGHRIETILQKQYYITSEAFLIDRLIVTPLVAIPILIVLIIYVFFRPDKKRY